MIVKFQANCGSIAVKPAEQKQTPRGVVWGSPIKLEFNNGLCVLNDQIPRQAELIELAREYIEDPENKVNVRAAQLREVKPKEAPLPFAKFDATPATKLRDAYEMFGFDLDVALARETGIGGKGRAAVIKVLTELKEANSEPAKDVTAVEVPTEAEIDASGLSGSI